MHPNACWFQETRQVSCTKGERRRRKDAVEGFMKRVLKDELGRRWQVGLVPTEPENDEVEEEARRLEAFLA